MGYRKNGQEDGGGDYEGQERRGGVRGLGYDDVVDIIDEYGYGYSKEKINGWKRNGKRERDLGSCFEGRDQEGNWEVKETEDQRK